jgi:hypothetical protein
LTTNPTTIYSADGTVFTRFGGCAIERQQAVDMIRDTLLTHQRPSTVTQYLERVRIYIASTINS